MSQWLEETWSTLSSLWLHDNLTQYEENQCDTRPADNNLCCRDCLVQRR